MYCVDIWHVFLAGPLGWFIDGEVGDFVGSIFQNQYFSFLEHHCTPSYVSMLQDALTLLICIYVLLSLYQPLAIIV